MNLIKNKTIFYRKGDTQKTRYYLIFSEFDSNDSDYVIGKSFPRKSRRQHTERYHISEIKLEKERFFNGDSFDDKFLVIKKENRLNKFFTVPKMKGRFSRSIEQALFFNTEQEALEIASSFSAKVITFEKGLKFHNGNKCN